MTSLLTILLILLVAGCLADEEETCWIGDNDGNFKNYQPGDVVEIGFTLCGQSTCKCDPSLKSQLECSFCYVASTEECYDHGDIVEIDGSTCTCESSSVNLVCQSNPTESPVPSTCTICPPQASMVSGSRIIPGSDMTCEEYNNELMMVGEDNCTSVKSEITNVNYDVQAFCGCTGVTPANTCRFCNGQLKDPDTEIDGSGGAVCADYERLENFIYPNSCSTYKDACCEMPTKPPTTDAAHTTSSFLVVVALSVITLLFSQL